MVIFLSISFNQNSNKYVVTAGDIVIAEVSIFPCLDTITYDKFA